MSAESVSLVVPTRLILLFVLLHLFFALNNSTTPSTSSSSPCPSSSSSCGNITNIRFPFRLKSDPSSCGLQHPLYHLDCQNNQTFQTINSNTYSVKQINYTQNIHTRKKEASVRLVDPGINRANLSSCPLYKSFDYPPSYYDNRTTNHFSRSSRGVVAFIHCISQVNSVKYVKAPFCGNRSNVFANSSKFYSYVIFHEEYFHLRASDLEDSCMVDKVTYWVSPRSVMSNSLANIYDALADGFEVTWFTDNPDKCWKHPLYKIYPPRSRYLRISHEICCYEDRSPYNCASRELAKAIRVSCLVLIVELLTSRLAIGFVIGFPLLIWVVMHKWQRRHLSIDKAIEIFLQGQPNLAPFMYTYTDIKKMTNKFSQKLGEGGHGIVYKGKLRSGPYVAIKMMEQSMATEEEFISEVGTIGQIHHVNIVQLIGFCVEQSKYALVYEFLPNGSFDRYIFNQQSLGLLALTFDKMFEIALGVARGINYLHHGCNMQILHFDIKPHNILLDEKFKPKISDFGLAKLHSTHESFINLTAARGTVGYMAPEMFYKNFGCISHKADVYSFGMMLMEMTSRRKNMSYNVDDTNQMYFPSWTYDQLCTGNDINVNDAMTKEEKLMVKKIMMVALWCIQLRPSDRPPMNKVVEMLEDETEPQMPPKPFINPCEIATNDDGISHSYSVDDIQFDLVED